MFTIKKRPSEHESEYQVVSARLTVEMVKKLDDLADETNLSRNAVIVQLLASAMEQVKII